MAAVAVLCGCSAGSHGPTAGGPSHRPPGAPSPAASGLLDSHPATLSAARAATALPVAIEVPGYPGYSPVRGFTTDPVTHGLDLPKDARTVAWWAGGALPGDPVGSAVLAAHVNYLGGRGPFTDLRRVAAGGLVRVRRADGSVLGFRVVARRQVVKAALDQQDVFRTTGPPQLALITCGGTYDRATHNYRDNVIVFAVPV